MSAPRHDEEEVRAARATVRDAWAAASRPRPVTSSAWRSLPELPGWPEELFAVEALLTGDASGTRRGPSTGLPAITWAT